jgi:hypothetical protein
MGSLVATLLKTGIFKRIFITIGLGMLALWGVGCSELIAGSPTPTPFRGVVYITVTPAPNQAAAVAQVSQVVPPPAQAQVVAPQTNSEGQPANQPASNAAPQSASQQPAQPTNQPANQPANQPTVQPTNQPTPTPISQPGQGTRVGFDPAAIEFASCEANQTTTIIARQINGLQGFEFKVRFDPNIVRIADADPALAGVQIALGDSFRSQTHFIAQNNVDLNSGLIDFAAVMLGSQGLSGDAVLAQIEWLPYQAGNTTLGLEQVQLSTGDGAPIQAQVNAASASVTQNCGG